MISMGFEVRTRCIDTSYTNNTQTYKSTLPLLDTHFSWALALNSHKKNWKGTYNFSPLWDCVARFDIEWGLFFFPPFSQYRTLQYHFSCLTPTKQFLKLSNHQTTALECVWKSDNILSTNTFPPKSQLKEIKKRKLMIQQYPDVASVWRFHDSAVG